METKCSLSCLCTNALKMYSKSTDEALPFVRFPFSSKQMGTRRQRTALHTTGQKPVASDRFMITICFNTLSMFYAGLCTNMHDTQRNHSRVSSLYSVMWAEHTSDQQLPFLFHWMSGNLDDWQSLHACVCDSCVHDVFRHFPQKSCWYGIEVWWGLNERDWDKWYGTDW